MNLRVRIVEDTTHRIAEMDGNMSKRLLKVAKRVAGEMQRGAKKFISTPTLMSPARKHIAPKIRSEVKELGPLSYLAIAGFPSGSETNRFAPYLEFGTGVRGKASASRHATKYGWPRIQYEVPFIRPKRAKVLSWQPRGRGTSLSEPVKGGTWWFTTRKGKRKYKFTKRVFVRWTRGMAAHPFLTPQPHRVKPIADEMIQRALEDEWNGKGSA